MPKKVIAPEVPCYLVDQFDGEIFNYVRKNLVLGLNRYFDENGNFKGININFRENVLNADEDIKTTKLAFTIEDEEYERLKKIKQHTTLSCKKIAEIILIKELINYV